MSSRGDEVAAAIAAQVREAIDRMVGDIRSSLEDVKEAVDQQFNAALKSIQADVNAVSLRPGLEQAIREFEESLAVEAPAPFAAPAAAPTGADSARIKKAIQSIEQGKSQVEVLNALLDQCVTFGSRAALLILKGDTFTGWKGAGFNAYGGNDEAIKRFSATPSMLAEFDRVLRQEQVVIWDGASLARKLGHAPPSQAILVPMVIKDKVAAAMYVDVVEADRTLDLNGIQLLVFTTGLLIDTLAIRKKIPSPSLSAEGPSVAATAPSRPQPIAAPAPPPQPRPAPRPVPPPLPDVPGAGETVAISGMNFQLESQPAAPPPPRPAPAPPRPTPAPPAAAPKPAPTAAASPSLGESGDRPSTQYVPPTGAQRGGAFATPMSEEAKKHDEARRFARLLVSEIKLYNEAKVEQGRKNRDLYERLKEDIDRSRQMYDERIPDAVRKASNYFYDELVRILADGDADALGL